MKEVMDIIEEKIMGILNNKLAGGYLVEKLVNGEVEEQYFYLNDKDWRSWRNEMLVHDGFKRVTDNEVEKEEGDETFGSLVTVRCKYIEIPDLFNFFRNLFETDI